MGVMTARQDQDTVVLTAEEKRRQRSRSIAIGLALFALVVIFYLVTIVRLGGNVFNRAI
jgi:hypothetical protein